MKTMTKREAVHRSAELWASAAEQPVYILERGKPRFRVEAIEEFDLLDELERQGILTRASEKPPPFRPIAGEPKYTSEQITALLDEMRGDH